MDQPFATQRLSGWGGYPAADTDVFRPERLSDLAPLLGARGHVIPRGHGRSYGDPAFVSGGGTVLMERLDRFLSLEDGVLEAEAGASLEQVLAHVVPQGWFLPVVPGTKIVTLGGALAADVHGKNHHLDGTFSRHVLDFDLRLPSGEGIRVDRDREPELFAATAGGMGLTGIIERVRLRLSPIESAYVTEDIDRTTDFEEALAHFVESDARYTFSVAWIDCLAKGRTLGRSVLLRGNWLPRASLDGRRAREPLAPTGAGLGLAVPFTAPGGLLNRYTVAAFNAAFYRKHPKRGRDVVTHYEPFFFPLDAVQSWNRMYGPRGFLQYQLLVPEAEAPEALRKVLESLAKAGAASFLSVLKRFGAGEPGRMLSFPGPGFTLALDLPHRGAESLALLDALDRIVLDHGGRGYLAKDARMSAATFRAMYPELPRFQAVRGRVDPAGRLQSDQSRRLEITS